MHPQLHESSNRPADAQVELINTGSAHDSGDGLEEGTAFCLSCGGYRAMPFHLGAQWRLYGASALGEVNRISSVSGGSFTAALG